MNVPKFLRLFHPAVQIVEAAIGRRFRVEHFALVRHGDDRIEGLEHPIRQNALAQQHGAQEFCFHPILNRWQAFPRFLLLVRSPACDIGRARVRAEPSHRPALDKAQHARQQRIALTKHFPVGRAPLEIRDVQCTSVFSHLQPSIGDFLRRVAKRQRPGIGANLVGKGF